jgi:hypothetical protein
VSAHDLFCFVLLLDYWNAFFCFLLYVYIDLGGCNGGRRTRADWNPRYPTKGKDKTFKCLRGVEWDAVITGLRKKARLLATMVRAW